MQKKKGIKIFNSPGAFTKGVSQYAIGVILNLTRKISENNQSVRNGSWEKFQGINIEKKKVGVVGLGKIGSQLIKYLKSFNVILYGNDNKKNVSDKFKKKGIKILSLNKIFSHCDIIVICVDLNQSSYHLIKKGHLMKLKENKILVNVSRGPVVDNSSLLIAIKKRNFQIGFDVFEQEPINKKTLKILRKKKTILSSHNAFNTKEEVDFVHENTMQNLLKGLRS